METKTKRSLIIWGIVFLVMLNISSLGTIWYHRYQFKTERITRENTQKRQNQHMHDRSDRKRMRPSIISRGLNLSEEQEIKFDSIWKDYAVERSSIEEEINKSRAELGKVLSANVLDTIAYIEISQHQTSLMDDLNRSMLNMNRELRSTLTDDQLKVFLEKIETLNKKMSSRARRK